VDLIEREIHLTLQSGESELFQSPVPLYYRRVVIPTRPLTTRPRTRRPKWKGS
jgi:hypothetical protein